MLLQIETFVRLWFKYHKVVKKLVDWCTALSHLFKSNLGQSMHGSHNVGHASEQKIAHSKNFCEWPARIVELKEYQGIKYWCM